MKRIVVRYFDSTDIVAYRIDTIEGLCSIDTDRIQYITPDDVQSADLIKTIFGETIPFNQISPKDMYWYGDLAKTIVKTMKHTIKI